MNDMGQFIDNYIIEKQERDIEELERELEQIKLKVGIKDFRIKDHLIDMTFHLNELLKLKEEIRKLLIINEDVD